MDLTQLKKISDLKFQQSEQVLSRLRMREASLRNELARLQSLRHETHSQAPEDAEIRAIGGDIIWLKWLAKNQRMLNIELAQILAQKETLVAQHQIANGKKMVTDALNEKQMAQKRLQKSVTSLHEAIEASVIKREP